MRATLMYCANDVHIEHVPDARLSQPPFDWAGQVSGFLLTETLCEGGIC
jgi:hypothetical protein